MTVEETYEETITKHRTINLCDMCGKEIPQTHNDLRFSVRLIKTETIDNLDTLRGKYPRIPRESLENSRERFVDKESELLSFDICPECKKYIETLPQARIADEQAKAEKQKAEEQKIKNWQKNLRGY